MLYEVSRYGENKKYIEKINDNFSESPEINVVMEELNMDDSMADICEKLNNNFSAYNATGLYEGLYYGFYSQMNIDQMFNIINNNFLILNPAESLIFT
ncbi:MAG: hypothetical protein BWY27_00754 [Bacteroidetes bacterium ADurb.Bin234]|jgi:hypothetical protein|nr:MAG: hypothetical protein BWY27_00754 [Bacteroidetes bacterium ADurb.Bin234]